MSTPFSIGSFKLFLFPAASYTQNDDRMFSRLCHHPHENHAAFFHEEESSLCHWPTSLQISRSWDLQKNFAETFAGRFTNCSLYPNWKCGKDGKGWMCGIAVVKASMRHFASLAQTLCFFTKFPCDNKQNTPSQYTTWNWSSIFPLVSTGMFLSILFAHKQTSSSSKFHQNL
jgi:hypothetical protein